MDVEDNVKYQCHLHAPLKGTDIYRSVTERGYDLCDTALDVEAKTHNPTVKEPSTRKGVVIECCGEEFSDSIEFDLHYTYHHLLSCPTCQLKIPNAHLLLIHETEAHDLLHNSLSCTVLGCSEKFNSMSDRKDHLVKRHHHPTDFRFLKQHDKHVLKKMSSDVSRDCNEGSSHNCHTKNNKKKVPNAICFGRGAQRSFHQHAEKGSGAKKPGSRKHWHNIDKQHVEGKDIEKMDFNDLKTALDDDT